MVKTGMKGAVMTVAFGVKAMDGNLFSTEMLLLKGGIVKESKVGEPTLMGHAIGQAQELLGGYAVSELETGPEGYFEAARVL